MGIPLADNPGTWQSAEVVAAKADTMREESCMSIGGLGRLAYVVRGFQRLNNSFPESFAIDVIT